MQDNASFWDIYKSDYYSKGKLLMLAAALAVWAALVVAQGLFLDAQLPAWVMAPFLLLLVELWYILNCYRKYKSHS